MDPKVIDTLRYVAMLAVFLIFGLVGFKFYSKHNARKAEVTAIRDGASDTNFYHALREEDAKATFLRCIGHLEKAHQLGVEPSELFADVFSRKKKDDFGAEDHSDGYPVAQKLVEETITTGWHNATQMGLFEEADAVKSLIAGEMPAMRKPPVIDHIVDPALSPGLEKVVPNLQLLPEPKKAGAVATDIELNSARQLIRDLADAGVIDHNAQKRILDAFDAEKPKS